MHRAVPYNVHVGDYDRSKWMLMWYKSTARERIDWNVTAMPAIAIVELVFSGTSNFSCSEILSKQLAHRWKVQSITCALKHAPLIDIINLHGDCSLRASINDSILILLTIRAHSTFWVFPNCILSHVVVKLIDSLIRQTAQSLKLYCIVSSVEIRKVKICF